MSEEPQISAKTQLALAIARGVAVQSWARRNNVPRETAFEWAKEPEVRKAVESHRRLMIDRAIGRLAEASERAAEHIASIAMDGKSNSVRSRARRALRSDMISVSKFSELERRLLKAEKRLAD
jgi:hypothetical protein